ncbi:MAG: hypothetical protein COZ08_10890, partial [Bacteroidetes bacterium CG_4_10_14_3_um_filter_42_6]
NQQVRSTANIYRKTRSHFLRCSAPFYFRVGSKATTHRAFKHFRFFSYTHSQHKKQKKLKSLPALIKQLRLLEQNILLATFGK